MPACERVNIVIAQIAGPATQFFRYFLHGRPQFFTDEMFGFTEHWPPALGANRCIRHSLAEFLVPLKGYFGEVPTIVDGECFVSENRVCVALEAPDQRFVTELSAKWRFCALSDFPCHGTVHLLFHLGYAHYLAVGHNNFT